MSIAEPPFVPLVTDDLDYVAPPVVPVSKPMILKNIILEHGWCQHTAIDPVNGAVCLLGAAWVATGGTKELGEDTGNPDGFDDHCSDMGSEWFGADSSDVVSLNDDIFRKRDEVLEFLDMLDKGVPFKAAFDVFDHRRMDEE